MKTIQKLIESTDEPLINKGFKLTRSMGRVLEDLAHKYDVDVSRIIRELLQPLLAPDAMPDKRLDFVHELCSEINAVAPVISTTSIESINEVAALKEQIKKIEKEKEQLEQENDRLINEANEWSLDLLDLRKECLDSNLMDDIIHDRKELEEIISNLKKEEDNSSKKRLLEEAQQLHKHLSSNMLKFKGVKNGQLIDRYMEEKKKLSALKRQMGQLEKLPLPIVKVKTKEKKVSYKNETLNLIGEEWEIVKKHKTYTRIRKVNDKLSAAIYYHKEGRINLDGDVGRSGVDVFVNHNGEKIKDQKSQ